MHQMKTGFRLTLVGIMLSTMTLLVGCGGGDEQAADEQAARQQRRQHKKK